jgi:glycosyltransferase involved in cell wall biosynthesis
MSRSTQSSGHDESAEPVVSVIVPCYNSEKTVRECLTAITSQRTPFPFEVIVVDSSTDETPLLVQREFPSVQLIHLNDRTFAGIARNIGVRAARASLCLMIDSDCIAEPDLIERMVMRHRQGDYAAIGGSLRNGTPGSLSGWVSYLIEFKEFMPSAPERLVWTVPTANVTYRKDVLARHGHFDPEMQLAEDILFNWKIHQAGERILFDPTIRVTHLNRTGLGKVLRYQINMGRFSARARRRGGLPGDFLLRYPVLITLMPFVRTFRAVQWLASIDWRALLIFVPLSPVYLLAAAFWSAGFFQEAMENRT